MRACSPLGEGYPRSQPIGKVCRSRICNVHCRNLLMCIRMLCNTSNLPWRARRTSGYACLSLSNICEFLFCCTRRCTNRELCLVRAGLLSRVLKRLCRAKLQRQRPMLVMPRTSCARWSRAWFPASNQVPRCPGRLLSTGVEGFSDTSWVHSGSVPRIQSACIPGTWLAQTPTTPSRSQKTRWLRELGHRIAGENLLRRLDIDADMFLSG